MKNSVAVESTGNQTARPPRTGRRARAQDTTFRKLE